MAKGPLESDCASHHQFKETSAFWYEDDTNAGLGLLSMRAYKNARGNSTYNLVSSMRNVEAKFLGTLVFVVGFALSHWLFHPLFKEQPRPNSKPRLAVLDNAKFIVMIFVVAVHTDGMPKEQTIYFHTRLLAMISGFVLRNRKPNRQGIRSLLVPHVFGLLLFVAVLGPMSLSLLVHRYDGHRKLTDFWDQTPRSTGGWLELIYNDFYFPWQEKTGTHIWYMEALILWQICGFLLFPLPPGKCLLISLAGYFLVWRLPPIPFAVSTTLTFLPFFFLGRLLPVERCLELLPELGARSLGAGVAIMTCLYYIQQTPLVLSLFDITDRGPDTDDHVRQGYFERGNVAPWEELGKSVFFSCVQLLNSFVFMVFLCPRSASWYTELGKHSLYTYHLHQIAISAGGLKLERYLNITMGNPPWLHMTTYFVWGTFLNALLACCHYFPPFRWILEPMWINDLVDQLAPGIFEEPGKKAEGSE